MCGEGDNCGSMSVCVHECVHEVCMSACEGSVCVCVCVCVYVFYVRGSGVAV